MIARQFADVPAETVEEGAEGVTIRWVITEADGAPNFAMRHFTLAPGGHTPHHSHGWEHEVFVLGGHGKVGGPRGETTIVPGTVILIPPHEEHHFVNDGDGLLTFLCLVPHQRD
jgi:quercetin dioxygenase-like cupin family protein